MGEITVYLKRLSAGDRAAEEPLAEAVYAHLQRISRGMLKSRSEEVSLQPTALVNTVLLELVRIRSIDWEDRAHFFRVASRLLRRRLIDHIRQQSKGTRLPTRLRVEFDDLLVPSEERLDEILFVNEGLDRLTRFDPALAELVEMVYFGGVTVKVCAELRNVSEKTIDRHLELARRWLRMELNRPCPSLAENFAYFDRP